MLIAVHHVAYLPLIWSKIIISFRDKRLPEYVCYAFTLNMLLNALDVVSPRRKGSSRAFENEDVLIDAIESVVGPGRLYVCGSLFIIFLIVFFLRFHFGLRLSSTFLVLLNTSFSAWCFCILYRALYLNFSYQRFPLNVHIMSAVYARLRRDLPRPT